jgi:hypothetical protein
MESKTANQSELEEILASWADEDQADTVTLNLAHTLSNVSITSPYTVGTGINFPNTIYTTAGTSSTPWTYNPTGVRSKIQLDGEGADIEVNGWSLVAAVKRIEERLGLFQPNPELEKEWEELRSLGEQYRQLEQQIKEKQATWDRLKAMPPPAID